MKQEEHGVLFVGALTLDTLYHIDDFSRGPGKYIAKEAMTMASGMATNAAFASVRLDGKSALWASVGSDAKATELISEIEAEGIDCTHIRCVEGGRSANAVIVVDGEGERWVVVDYDPHTQSDPSISELPPVENFGAVMADVRWPGAAKIALDKARESGRIAILDADVASPEVLKDLSSHATHVVASADGAEILCGLTNPREATLKIAQDYGCFVCVTNGEKGTFWAEPEQLEVRHTPAPIVDVVDTNGAGDVFHGAFALAMAEGKSEERAIQFASCAAALKCTVFGGRLGAPNRQETLQFLKEIYNEEY